MMNLHLSLLSHVKRFMYLWHYMLTFDNDACYEDFLTWLTYFEQKILNIENRLQGTGKE